MFDSSQPIAVLQAMLEQDRFTKWLGLQLEACSPGYCRLHYTIKEDMLNGFNKVHGGILFSASDSALAFACNAHGTFALALDANISFARTVSLHETLTVTATELYAGNKIAMYDVCTINSKGEMVATFKGTAYRKSAQTKNRE